MQNTECRIQTAECRIQTAECRIQTAESRIQNTQNAIHADLNVNSLKINNSVSNTYWEYNMGIQSAVGIKWGQGGVKGERGDDGGGHVTCQLYYTDLYNDIELAHFCSLCLDYGCFDEQ